MLTTNASHPEYFKKIKVALVDRPALNLLSQNNNNFSERETI